MLKILMTAAMAAVSCFVGAQNTIKGYVKDSHTSELLPGATIVLKEGGQFATTDDRGYFQLDNLDQVTYQAEIRFLGYETKIQELNSITSNDVFLEEAPMLTEEVIVSATRASEKSASTFSNINKLTLQKQNFGQDLPLVLNYTPSLVTTSDAGAGVGYTGVRIRGSDATRINVTINGIPLNDSESQGVYWVDVPDIASSTQSLQIQRGVGTSTNGAGAFGASINLQTNTRNDKPYADVINSFGSFKTHRHTVGFGTGLIDKKFVFDGRMSSVNSDGYIDRASSSLKSFYLSGGYYGDKTIIKALAFGGNEVTYQSWYGVPQSRLNGDISGMQETIATEGWNAEQAANLLNANSRTFNIYTYPNQVDNYSQDHHQLHVSHRFNQKLTGNVALHHTYGRGYYEEFKYDESLSRYGLNDVVIGNDTIGSSDIVRRRWLKNHFYGATWSLNYEGEKLNSILGGGWNRYDGDHYGELTWAAQNVGAPKDYRYYFNNGVKTDFNIFWKNTWQVTSGLSAFVDLQFRNIDYDASGKENKGFDFDIQRKFRFFNPKLGATYTLNQAQHLYASFSVAHREPVRDDLVYPAPGAIPKPETLKDLELGWRFRQSASSLNINYFLMDYTNQLVLTGALNDVGASLRTNVARSYRTGIEIEGSTRFSEQFTLSANLMVSRNKVRDYQEVLNDYGPDFDQSNLAINQFTKTDISFSPNVIAGAIFSYFPVKNLEASFLTKYVDKQYLDNTSNEQRTISSYMINDIRLIYTLHPAGLREISFSLLVNNIFNVKYQSNGYTYGYLGGGATYRQNYYYPQAGRNLLGMVAIRF